MFDAFLSSTFQVVDKFILTTFFSFLQQCARWALTSYLRSVGSCVSR